MRFDKFEDFWYRNPVLGQCIKLTILGAIVAGVVIYGVMVSSCGQTAPKVDAPELTFHGDAPEALSVTNSPKTSSKQTQNNPWPWMIAIVVNNLLWLLFLSYTTAWRGRRGL